MLYSFNDWWSYIRIKASLSILCQSPFPGEDEEEVFDSIVNDDVQYPGCLSPDSISINQKVTTPLSLLILSLIFVYIWKPFRKSFVMKIPVFVLNPHPVCTCSFLRGIQRKDWELERGTEMKSRASNFSS